MVSVIIEPSQLEVVVLQIPKTTTSNVLPNVEKPSRNFDKDKTKTHRVRNYKSGATCRNFNYSINSYKIV